MIYIYVKWLLLIKYQLLLKFFDLNINELVYLIYWNIIIIKF